jgi:acylphosphatase
MGAPAALRATVRGRVQGVGFRQAVVDRARGLGLRGWVRNEEDGSVRVHAEGDAEAVAALRAFLGRGPRGAEVERVEEERARVEGHEQFAVRGVPAGTFVVVAGSSSSRFALRLEVAGGLRAWSLAREPSMDPAVRRMAIELAADEPDGTGTEWDRGPYVQGGRVPWPEALERGHAVFVLHGARLRGGFALQRTRGEGPGAQWLLVKRRDEHAARG